MGDPSIVRFSPAHLSASDRDRKSVAMWCREIKFS